MRYKRLGKFRFADYYLSWISIAILIFFSIATIRVGLHFLYALFSLSYATIWLGVILYPHCEQFSINDNSISVFRGRQIKKIRLPEEITLILSYADVCPPLTVRTAFGRQSHILKGRFAISILQKMPVEDALQTLHQNYIQKYTTSSVRAAFDDYLYIYSFVCDQFLFDALVDSKKCLLIIPESLSKAITFESRVENVYIDTGH